MQFFQVKGFEKLQHYKDRAPPWIKLYNAILDDYEFGCLPDASKMHLLAIMLLASRSDNKIPYDSEWVAKRISATEPVDLNRLVKAGFIVLDQVVQLLEQVASTTLAECLSREREEGEREKEKKEKKDGADAPVGLVPLLDEEKQYFDRSKQVLGPKGNGLAAKLLKSKGKIFAVARAALETASTKSDPAAYIGAVIRGANGEDRGAAQKPGYGDIWW